MTFRHCFMPEPASKVDQVPRTCTTWLRKNTTTKEFYNKDGVKRFINSHKEGNKLKTRRQKV